MIKNALIISTSVTLALAASACTPEDPEAIGETQSYAYVLSSVLWENKSIPVCWTNPSAAPAAERAWVANAIRSSWQRWGNVEFTGFGACSSSSHGLRIKIADEGPYTTGLGDELDGVNPGMVLNFSFNNWEPNCKLSNTKRRQCVEWTAVHEFGHALGFAHEQNRPDTPSSCTEDPQGEDGDTSVGSWDLDSIMNYCNPDWNNLGVLSDGDRKALQLFYGLRKPGNFYLTPTYISGRASTTLTWDRSYIFGQVDVFRNSVKVATTDNDGSYIHSILMSPGSASFYVCFAGATTSYDSTKCSRVATATYGTP